MEHRTRDCRYASNGLKKCFKKAESEILTKYETKNRRYNRSISSQFLDYATSRDRERERERHNLNFTRRTYKAIFISHEKICRCKIGLLWNKTLCKDFNSRLSKSSYINPILRRKRRDLEIISREVTLNTILIIIKCDTVKYVILLHKIIIKNII